jgi:hypothetical protein
MAKPRKVEESAVPYLTAKPAASKVSTTKKADAPTIRYADDATFRKAADKVFKTHDELFRKLAQ